MSRLYVRRNISQNVFVALVLIRAEHAPAESVECVAVPRPRTHAENHPTVRVALCGPYVFSVQLSSIDDKRVKLSF